MKKKTKIIVIILGAVILVVGGGVGGWFLHKRLAKAKIRIIEKTKTVTRYIKNPDSMNCDDLRKCAKSPISIDGHITDNILYTMASDGCKASEMGFKLKGYAIPPKNTIGFDYIGIYIDGTYYSNYNPYYYRRLGPVWLGGGPVLTRNESTKKFGGGFKAGAFAQF